MIEDLRALRDQLDRVLGDLERLAPVLAAWRAVPDTGAEAPGSVTEVPGTITPANGAAPSGASPSGQQEAIASPVCPECGRAFRKNTARQKFCSSECRNRTNLRRYDSERAQGLRPPRGQVRGPGKPGRAPAEPTEPAKPEEPPEPPPSQCPICFAPISDGSETCGDPECVKIHGGLSPRPGSERPPVGRNAGGAEACST